MSNPLISFTGTENELDQLFNRVLSDEDIFFDNPHEPQAFKRYSQSCFELIAAELSLILAYEEVARKLKLTPKLLLEFASGYRKAAILFRLGVFISPPMGNFNLTPEHCLNYGRALTALSYDEASDFIHSFAPERAFVHVHLIRQNLSDYICGKPFYSC